MIAFGITASPAGGCSLSISGAGIVVSEAAAASAIGVVGLSCMAARTSDLLEKDMSKLHKMESELREGTRKVESLIKNDPGLVKAAEEMAKNQAVQKEANNLINQFLNGNSNPGLGSKNLFKDISYLRGRNGARVFYRIKNGVMEILGKSSKANEQKVINILKNLYE